MDLNTFYNINCFVGLGDGLYDVDVLNTYLQKNTVYDIVKRLVELQ